MAGIFFIGGFLVGAILLMYGFSQLSKAGAVTGKRVISIGAIRGGYFQFSGSVVPLTTTRTRDGVECVYYFFHEEELRQTRRPVHRRGHPGSEMDTQWVTVSKDERALEFLLQDSTGIAHVRPQGAEFHFRVDHKSGGPGASNRRVTEIWVKPGDHVNVIAASRPGPALRRSKAPQPGLGGVRGAGIAVEARADGGRAPTTDDARLVLSKPRDGLFLITDRPREELAGRFQTRAVLSLGAGSFVLAGAALVLLASILGAR